MTFSEGKVTFSTMPVHNSYQNHGMLKKQASSQDHEPCFAFSLLKACSIHSGTYSSCSQKIQHDLDGINYGVFMSVIIVMV